MRARVTARPVTNSAAAWRVARARAASARRPAPMSPRHAHACGAVPHCTHTHAHTHTHTRCAWRRSSAATWTPRCATPASPTCLSRQQVCARVNAAGTRSQHSKRLCCVCLLGAPQQLCLQACRRARLMLTCVLMRSRAHVCARCCCLRSPRPTHTHTHSHTHTRAHTHTHTFTHARTRAHTHTHTHTHTGTVPCPSCYGTPYSASLIPNIGAILRTEVPTWQRVLGRMGRCAWCG
jgi:hypothetical protein